jgi:hypothetical protein
MAMKQTAVEFLVENLIIKPNWVQSKVIKQAKEMEETTATEYAEFCIRCDRASLPLVKFEDWIKELTFKSE